jgi:DNA invertase Pin-like site-specific DNA recombinase
MVGRPGLTRALERIAAGDARGLVVSDVRRLVRSVGDLGALLEWLRDAGAALVALDLDLDTATADGRQTASAIIALAGWEGERTTSRARRGLARVQTPERQGAPTREQRAQTAERVRAMRAAGMSPQAIAHQLNSEGVAPPTTATGWSGATVEAVLGTAPRRQNSIRDELPAIPTHRRRK